MVGDTPICLGCRRFHHDRDGLTCEAFPDEIPVKILANQADHREPYAGDRGLQFVPRDAAAAATAEERFPSGEKRARET